MIDFSRIPFEPEDMKELMLLEIDYVFQPIFDARTLEISAYEALMRPKDKSPLELIDEYEKQDKLYILELATCFGATIAYKERGYSQYLCLNTFPSEVMNEIQTKLYFECFPDIGEKIIVEVLEYTELNRPKWAEKKAEIFSHNERIALDDYLTGNNDSAAIEFFNPQYVKIDRSVISNIHQDGEKQKILQELIPELHARGIEVVAEGVETKEEMDYLRNWAGVDYLQGYYLARPS